ncbi:MAG TPA: hypothetical protein VHC69_03060 [Polyangiaceae bacterium]|nr:hypothetical protein [Polyangiaceae bacterium]
MRHWLLFCVCAVGCATAESAPPPSDEALGSGQPGATFNPLPSIVDPATGSGTATAACTQACQVFPAAPIVDTSGPTAVPGDAPSRFGAADDFDASSGPCVVEPALAVGNAPGALFPANWLRPRFRFQPGRAADDLFEIRMRAPSAAGELVAYTTATTWTLPLDVWKLLAASALDQPITVTIRETSSTAGGRPAGTRGTFQIAPVLAGGTMVYWATTSSDVTPTTNKLAGFRVGDESVVDALTVPEVQTTGLLAEGGRDLRSGNGVDNGHVECIGCHVSTPDGNAVGFTDHWPWNDVMASIEPTSTGASPPYLTPGAKMLLDQPWLGMMSFSKAHFSTGDRIAITSYQKRGNGGVGWNDAANQGGDRIAWFDLETSANIPWQQGQPDPTNAAVQSAEGTAWGFVQMNGETQSAVTPSFSHDGTRIAYTSASATQDGRIGDNAETDVHIVPFANRAGGTVTALAGASTNGVSEYYPSFSADDRLIAFNRASSTSGKIYYRPDAEVNVIDASGGAPVRLAANDPAACSGEKSPGVINSWAKWSPSVITTGGKSYYFLIFSSARDYPGTHEVPKNQYSPSDTRASQLYMTAVVRDESSGKLTTYGAVYLWNQDPTTSNLTPAWDSFNIPPVPPPR